MKIYIYYTAAVNFVNFQVELERFLKVDWNREFYCFLVNFKEQKY